jgi:hypothetical protein
MDLRMGRPTAEPYNRHAVNEIMKLKAHAYDVISAIEQLQRELQAVNAEIAKKSQEHADAMKAAEHDA